MVTGLVVCIKGCGPPEAPERGFVIFASERVFEKSNKKVFVLKPPKRRSSFYVN
jgi:hypothetical protein